MSKHLSLDEMLECLIALDDPMAPACQSMLCPQPLLICDPTDPLTDEPSVIRTHRIFPMPKFTIETSYRRPYFRHRTYEAPTPEEACQHAINDPDDEEELPAYELAGDTYVSAIWIGKNAAYRTKSLPVPSQFEEAVQRKAQHFDVLAALLAEAALVKAVSIRTGAPDPVSATPNPGLNSQAAKTNKTVSE